ncbi:MAG TPA: hypothetical protein VFO76_11830, partial [Candidatus Kapabacteria bacterium]|nr:hypothetical protein [Candidatus Kapabacteria bacterium]
MVKKITQLLIVFVGFLSLYLLTLSHNLAASHDSIAYINDIDSGRWFFHPHHLLYHMTCVGWLWLLRALGCNADSSLVVASLNSIFGAASLATIYYILKRFFYSPTSTAVSTITLIGSSYGFWYYSICVEVYIIPLFFLLLGMSFLLKQPLKVGDIVWTGLFNGVAVLYHQSFALIGFAVLARLYLTPKDYTLTKIKAGLLYGLSAGLVVLLGYLAVIVFNNKETSIGHILSWLTLYAHNDGSATPSGFWNLPSLHSAMKAIVGISHSIIGGQFAFTVPGFKKTFSALLPGHILDDELYLIRNSNLFTAIGLSIVTIIFFSIVLITLCRSARDFKTIITTSKNSLIPIITWLFTFSIFFFIWDPSNLEFWIPQSVIFWLLFDRLLQYRESRYLNKTSSIRIVLPVLLVIVNFFGSIILLHSRSNDCFFVQSTALANAITPGDIIITEHQWIVEQYYKRFINVKIYSPKDLIHGNTIDDSIKQHFCSDVLFAFSNGKTIISSFPIDSAGT